MSRLAISVLVLLAFIAMAMAGHKYLRKSSPTYNFLLSPSDLHSSLAETDFNLSSAGFSKELAFTVKYPGNHWISITVENPVSTVESYDSDFEVQVSIRSEGKVISEAIKNDTSFSFFGGPEKSGFALTTYIAPGDLPIGKPLTASITVFKESAQFTEKYGEQMLTIGKFSDE